MIVAALAAAAVVAGVLIAVFFIFLQPPTAPYQREIDEALEESLEEPQPTDAETAKVNFKQAGMNLNAATLPWAYFQQQNLNYAGISPEALAALDPEIDTSEFEIPAATVSETAYCIESVVGGQAASGWGPASPPFLETFTTKRGLCPRGAEQIALQRQAHDLVNAHSLLRLIGLSVHEFAYAAGSYTAADYAELSDRSAREAYGVPYTLRVVPLAETRACVEVAVGDAVGSETINLADDAPESENPHLAVIRDEFCA